MTRIEILTSPNSKGPSMDWLAIAKSASTRNKINQWFKRINKEGYSCWGRELMQSYTQEATPAASTTPSSKSLLSGRCVLRKYGFRDWDALLAAIGHGGMKEGQVVNKLLDLYTEDHRHQATNEEIIQQVQQNSLRSICAATAGGTGSVIVKGVHGVSIRSPAAIPVPGDQIVGFITREEESPSTAGTATTSTNCQVRKRGRIIEAAWTEDAVGRRRTGSWL